MVLSSPAIAVFDSVVGGCVVVTNSVVGGDGCIIKVVTIDDAEMTDMM